jgi:hypothetical protein
MDMSFDSPTNQITDLLEGRLRRIEYVMTGQSIDIQNEHSTTVMKRLRNLELDLDRILAKSKASQELLKLRMFS